MSGISEALPQARHRNARFSAEGISGLMTAAVDMPEALAMEAGWLGRGGSDHLAAAFVNSTAGLERK